MRQIEVPLRQAIPIARPIHVDLAGYSRDHWNEVSWGYDRQLHETLVGVDIGSQSVQFSYASEGSADV